MSRYEARNYATNGGGETIRSIVEATKRFSDLKRPEVREPRYVLWRRWDARPLLFSVMLNSSTADASIDDHTIALVRSYAQRWGMGGFVVANAFAMRSRSPQAVLSDPQGAVGPENDAHIAALRAIYGDGTVVVAPISN